VLHGGFCVYSCTVVLENTVGYALTLRGVATVEPVWQFTKTVAYAVVAGTWALALWKSAPTEESRPALLTTSLYRQISPQINERLYLLNEQLNRFWGPGATRQ
jgi:hypothetical protein